MATIIDSIVRGNVAETSDAGGISVSEYTTLINSLVVGNEALHGNAGGIYGSAMELVNTTVVGNRAGDYGGGIYNPDVSNDVVLNNSIVALNEGQIQADVYGTRTGSHYLIGADPMFVRNPSAGADGLWGTSDDDYGDLRLTAGSPALDAGDNTLLPADTFDLDGDGDTAEVLPLDLAGNTRIMGTAVDIGAYEWPYIPGDANLDQKVDLTDLIALGQNYGKAGTWASGDFNGDNMVDLSDLIVLGQNYGEDYTNQSPIISNATFSLAEDAADGTVVGTVTASDPDAGPDPLTYSIVGGNDAGIFEIDAATGTIAVADHTNLDYENATRHVLTVRASDGADSDDAMVEVNVTDLNDTVPVINNATFSVAEDATGGTAVGTVTATDPDTVGSLVYSITAGNGDGVFGIDASTGEIAVADTTNLDFETTTQYILTVEVSDGVAVDQAAITINVTDVAEVTNTAPTANDDSIAVEQDASGSGSVTATDPDVGDTLTYSVVSSPSHGTLTSFDTSTGAYTYRPGTGFTGSDSFTFRAFDGELYSNTATVSITVTPAMVGELLVNAGFEAGDLSNWKITSSGQFNIDATDPQAGSYDVRFVGTSADQGLYQNNIDLTAGETYTLTAYYRVDGIGNSDTWRRAEIGFFPNGGPGWGNELAYTAIDEKVLTGGWVEITCEYTPTANETVSIGFVNFQTNSTFGLDSFSLTGPGSGSSNTAPTAFDGSFSVYQNVTHSGSVTASDPDSGDTLTYSVVTPPSHGTLTAFDVNSGAFTYDPDDSYSGSDSFTFRGFDGTDWSNTATVSITVLAVSGNVAPVAWDASFACEPEQSVGGSVLATDANDDALTYEIVSQPGQGTLTAFDAATGAFTYTAGAGFLGDDTFTFRAFDGDVWSNTATASVKVREVETAAYEWAQDFNNAGKTSVALQDPGDSSNWDLTWAWNGPDSTPGTADAHLYDAPALGKITTGGAYIYAPAGSNGLYALRKSDGTVAWQFAQASVNASAAYDVASGHLYVGGADGVLYKVDVTDGSIAGSYDTQDAINLSTTLRNGYAYVVTDSGTLHKIDTDTMTLAWTSAYQAGSAGHTPAAISTATGKVTFCTYDLNVHAVNDADGSLSWKVKPTVNDPGDTADGWYREFWGGTPVIAEQHGLVFVRMATVGAITSGPGPSGIYDNDNASIRQWLIDHPDDQNLFALDLSDGSTRFIPAVGPGGVEMANDFGPRLRMQAMPIVKTYDNGDEVVYIQYRNGSSAPPDGRWDSHLGEMVLDDTTVPGMAAGDLRFVQFDNSQVFITDEQTPLTMAGNTIFNAHWGASESAYITDRSDSLGSYASPIATTDNSVVIRRLRDDGYTYNTTTHWHNGGLTLFDDGRYWDGPGWWAYWNTMDPPGEKPDALMGSAYSAGILPRYSIVADGMIIVEGNGGDLMVFDTSVLNTRPIVESSSVSTAANAPYVGNVTGSDLEGSALTYLVVDQPAHGTVAMAADGTYTYTPDTNWSGTDSFTFQAFDGTDSGHVGRITFTVDGSSVDMTAPAAISDLTVTEVGGTSVTFTWTATGDDGSSGTASAYDIRWNDNLPVVQNWDTSTQVDGEPVPAAAGTQQSMTLTGLTPGAGYSLAIKVVDDAGNWSPVSNMVNFTPDEPVVLVNLLTNGGFETGSFSGWTAGSGYTIDTSDPYEGSYAAKSVNSDMEQVVATEAGKSYKITARVRFLGKSGSDWGGMRIAALDQNWTTLASSGYLSYDEQWAHVGVDFTAGSSQTRIKVGYFGGGGQSIQMLVDDVAVFENTGANQLPVIDTVTVTPTTSTSVPVTQQFSVVAHDPDGAIESYVWEFGDGDRVYGYNGSRTLGVVGDFTGTVYVVDDEGGVASQTFTWSASDVDHPSITLDATPSEVSTRTVTLTGTASGTGVAVDVSTDRGVLADASGTADWSVDVDLLPGNNRVMVQAVNAAGQIATVEKTIRYVPSGALGVSNVSLSAGTAEQWDTLEITFDVDNSAATHPQFPHDPSTPAGLDWVDGCSVNAVFWLAGDPGTLYERPAFLRQNYDTQMVNGKEWSNPIGDPVWTVRFSPPQQGQWRFRIDVAEARGTASSGEMGFSAVAPSANNHGPIVVSPTDSRYFEYADGTYFNGNGHNTDINSVPEAEQFFQEIGYGQNQQFFRWWISPETWGAAWQAWTGGDQVGNTPGTALSVDNAYGENLAAVKLSNDTDVVFNFYGHAPELVVGERYRVAVRWRTVGVDGPVDAAKPYGLALKLTGWPKNGTDAWAPLIGHETGTTPWHVSEADFVATDAFMTEYISFVLENASAGEAYIDEITIRQVRPDGSFGPNVVQDPMMNSYKVFDPAGSDMIERVLDQAEEYGLGFKLVIEEKEEWLLNHWAPSGLPDPSGGNYFTLGDTAVHDLHTYYWRYLMARFGSYRSVQSWEFVNEAAPNHQNMYTLTNEIGQMAVGDGNPHLASTSVWAGMDDEVYTAPAFADIGMGDFHAYIDDTGWLGPKPDLALDTARGFHAYDMDALSHPIDKPWVWGEVGVGSDFESQLANDAEGVWLHKLTWARAGAGGLYPLYWYSNNIFGKDLHGIYGAHNAFMADVPVSNGHYVDAATTSSHTDMRVFGQKDVTNGRAHLWIDNANHTWKNVVDGVGIASVSGTVTLDMGPANASYDIRWYNTSTGQVSSTASVTADGSGSVSLAVGTLAEDIAVKIDRILTVSNITESSSGTYALQTDAMTAGASLYTDGSQAASAVPDLLDGLTYIRTADADAQNASAGVFLSFDVNRSVTVYIAHDDRYATKPAWLTDWTDTGEDLISTTATLSVYSRTFDAGTISLGSNADTSELEDNDMYVVVIAPLA